MQIDSIAASFLTVCLGCFFSVNLQNVLMMHKHDDEAKPYAEVERPSGITMTMAAIGTFAYFAEAILYPFLVFANLLASIDNPVLRLQTSLIPYTQMLGLVSTGCGYFLSMWSVVARKEYSVSWAMRKDHRLVTWGPYRYVRHPSYLAYFLMFVGLFMIWPGLITIVPLMAIVGYLHVTLQEENLLIKRFGKEYAEYQKKTGRILPKIRMQTSTQNDRKGERDSP